MTDDPTRGPDDLGAATAPADERRTAQRFAGLVDKAIHGRLPAAVGSDDRDLLEVAEMLRAGAGRVRLDEGRAAALVEQAMVRAVGGSPVAAGPVRGATVGSRRTGVWVAITTAAALAAGTLGYLGARRTHPSTVAVAPSAAPDLPAHWRSRPADAVVGRIDRADAGRARERADAIFADRLDGFRERRFAGVAPAVRGAKP